MKHLSDAMTAHILAGKLIAEAAWKLALEGEEKIDVKMLLETALAELDKSLHAPVGPY